MDSHTAPSLGGSRLGWGAKVSPQGLRWSSPVNRGGRLLRSESSLPKDWSPRQSEFETVFQALCGLLPWPDVTVPLLCVTSSTSQKARHLEVSTLCRSSGEETVVQMAELVCWSLAKGSLYKDPPLPSTLLHFLGPLPCSVLPLPQDLANSRRWTL